MEKDKLNIPDWMIIDAIRYCIGRQSCQVSTTTEWIIENWKSIDQNTRDIIKRDIEEAFEREARATGLHFRPLGMDCDKQQWENMRKLWKK